MIFKVESQKSNTAIKTQIDDSWKIWICSPFVILVGINLIFLDEVELEEQVQDDEFKLVLKEDIGYFTALALDFLQEHGTRK